MNTTYFLADTAYWVCRNCASDETPDDMRDTDPTPWGEWPVGLHAMSNPDTDPETGEDTGNGYYSLDARPCDGCGTRLAGARYRYAAAAYLVLSASYGAREPATEYGPRPVFTNPDADGKHGYTNPYAVGGYDMSPAPLSGQTVSGYGGRIPLPYRVNYAGRWRRVYVMQYGNSGSAYIRVHGEPVFLDIDTEHGLMAARDAAVSA